MSGADYLDREAERLMIKDVDWDRYLKPDDKAKVRDASTYFNELKSSLLVGDAVDGLTLPWKKATGFHFRTSELTVWTGYNGHKKSLLMGYALMGLIAQNASACIASLEMKPTKTLKRMLRQYSGCSVPTIPNAQGMLEWFTERVWFYDQVGSVKPERMIAVARYAVSELGVSHFVIDSLMKCGIAEDDYNRQKWFVNELATIASDTCAHIHLVAHSKKPHDSKETIPSSKYTVKGTSSITDMADNALIVFCDKDDQDGKVLLICDKQRDGEQEPRYQFNFCPSSLQFKPEQFSATMQPEDWKVGRWL